MTPKKPAPAPRKARDWPGLGRALKEFEAAITPEARKLWLDGNWADPRAMYWQDYLEALQSALVKRDPSALLKLLDGLAPFPHLLLPVLAEVIRDTRNGLSDGRPLAFTHADDLQVRRAFEVLRLTSNIGDAHDRVADIWGVSVDTVKRSLKRTEEAPKK